jgi:hypothetical protein
MLTNGQFAVITRVDRGIHDALHLRTHIGDGSDQQRIAGELRDRIMKLGVGFDEAHVTGAIVHLVFCVG